MIKQSTAFTFFAGFICFFVMWEISASSDFKALTNGEKSESECRDIFHGFPESSEDIPGYVEQLEAVLKNSDNIHEKELAVKFLGKVVIMQPDLFSRVFQILTDILQNMEFKDPKDNLQIEEATMDTMKDLVLRFPAEKFALQLKDQLIAVFLKETKKGDNISLPVISVQNLYWLTQKYPQKALLIIENIFQGIIEVFKEDLSDVQSETPDIFEDQSFAPKNEILDNSSQTSLSDFPANVENMLRKWRIEDKKREAELEKIEKDWLKKQRNSTRERIIEQTTGWCTKIVLDSPSNVQKEIVDFLRNIIRSSEHPKVIKDMALKIYGDFALEKMGK